MTIRVAEQAALKSRGGKSLFVSFPYDRETVDEIRKLPQKWWHQSKKEWEVPVEQFGTLLSKFFEKGIRVTGELVEIPCPDANVPEGFEFKTKPFQHQVEGFQYGLAHDRWFLGDEMGLGKTKQVIDVAVAKKLQRNYAHCLIICGVNGLKWNWRDEIATHSDEGCRILGERRRKNGRAYIGGNSEKMQDLQTLGDEYFLVTNVETLRDKEIVKRISMLCQNGTIGMVAFDEFHVCRNPTSQQGKGVLKVQAETQIAMTGTPLMNRPLDLYVVFKWLGVEQHTYYAFRNHYCEMGGFGGYEVVGYKNMGEIRQKLSEIMLRRLKADVLDLPEKAYVNEYVEMGPEQRKIYLEAAEEVRENIDMVKSSPNPLSQLLRMRQATGYTGLLSSRVFKSAKLDRMLEIVEEATQNGNKVVVFSNWEMMVGAAMDTLPQSCGARRITGSVPDAERAEAVREFQGNKDCKVVCGTVGAMGTGITLTAGTVEIFLDEPWTNAAKEQAVDRCHRTGTTQRVTVYTLLAKDTIDEKIHRLVMEKGAMADAIVDGKLAMERADVVDFLLS